MKIKIPLILIAFCLGLSCYSQPQALYQKLFDTYDTFKDTSIVNRRFKHQDITNLLNKLEEPTFEVKQVGQSIEGKSINLVKIGNGPKKVLLWSQMHGNEPTATMALMDIFNLFKNDSLFTDFKSLLQRRLSIYVIPMLNPDGANQFKRRNAVGVDINRDALRLQCPESQILKAVRDSLDADWGFNLHDQSRYYAAGNHPFQASISFLAPAYNSRKNVNKTRGEAMKLIAYMNNILQRYIPNHVGKYSDAFEPRAFGDNIQKWGTRTILIETGGYPDDREKQYLRKINYIGLLGALHGIAMQNFTEIPISQYNSIPFNRYNAFHDLILRKVKIVRNRDSFQLDIAIKQDEIQDEKAEQFYLSGYISDLGDLSNSFGYLEIEVDSLQAIPGKTYTKQFEKLTDLEQLDPLELFQQGYTSVIVQEEVDPLQSTACPLKILTPKHDEKNIIKIGRNPSLLLKVNEELKFVLINGSLVNIESEGPLLKERLISSLLKMY